MEIKILGGGCPKCERLEAVTRSVVEAMGLEAEFTKVKSMTDIMSHDVLTTPALVIDEKVFCAGRIPTAEEIHAWLEELSK